MANIQARGRGVWRIVVEDGRDPLTGRRRRTAQDVRGTKKEAEREMARLVHQRASGDYVPPHRETVGQFLERWLAYMESRVAPSTLHSYRRICETRLVPMLGSVAVQQLRVDDIVRAEQRWLTGGRLGRWRRDADPGHGKALSPKTVLNYHRVLSEALTHAVRWNVIAYNPADRQHMEPPRFERAQVPVLSLAEAQRLLAVLPDERHGVSIQVMISTGLRVGEVLGLRWQDVDPSLGILRVQQQYDRLLKHFRATKSHRSRRPVDLDSATVALLHHHKAQQAERQLRAGPLWRDTGLVFTDNLGGHLTHDTLRRTLDHALKAAGLGHVTRHGLRHTHASLLVALGTHMKTIQERLGHASFAITADTYSHLAPGLQAGAAEQLRKALRGVAP